MSGLGGSAAARGGGSKRVRIWPPTRPPGPGEAVRTSCARCGLDWDVHEALAGFRLRCECDAWVPVPHPLGSAASIAAAPQLPVFTPPVRSAYADESSRRGQPVPQRRPKAAKPKRKRARVVDAGLIGTLALTAAIAVPIVSTHRQHPELSWAVLWPAMGGVTAVLLGIAALFGRSRYLTALRKARFSHLLEGLGVGLLGGAALTSIVLEVPRGSESMVWVYGLIEELGVPLATIALVLLPAFGHALFFREVFARRLGALVPATAAAILASLALAASHGIGPFTPLIATVALHAAWLRKRSRSALPGLLEDLAVAGVVFGALVVG